jgi:uncharacterized membrane protein
MRLKDLDLGFAVMIAVMSMLWAVLSSRAGASHEFLQAAQQAAQHAFFARWATAAAAQNKPAPTLIGILLALLLVFVLPGYTLTEVMFHKGALESSHRLLLSLALSLAIDILSGFILNLLPGGLQAVSWAALLGAVTVVFALLAAFLRRGRLYRVPSLPRNEQGKHKTPTSLSHQDKQCRVRAILPGGQVMRARAATSAPHDPLPLHVVPLPVPKATGQAQGPHTAPHDPLSLHVGARHFMPLRDYMLLGLALFMAILSIEYAVSSVSQQPYPGFTQLWMVPPIQDSRACVVRIGVRSFEATSMTYRVVVRMNGVRVRTWARVVLAPRQEWDEVVSVAPRFIVGVPTTAGNVYIEVRLYRLDQPETVYRNVHVTLKAVASRLWARSGSKMLWCEAL